MRKQAGDIAIRYVMFYRKPTMLWIWQILKRKDYWYGLSILLGCGLAGAYILESGMQDTGAPVVHFYGSAVFVVLGSFLAVLALSILLLFLYGLRYDPYLKSRNPRRNALLVGFMAVLAGVFLMSTRFAIYALSTKATLTDEWLTYRNIDTNLSIQLVEIAGVGSDYRPKQVCAPFNFHTHDRKTVRWDICYLATPALLESAVRDRLYLKMVRPLF